MNPTHSPISSPSSPAPMASGLRFEGIYTVKGPDRASVEQTTNRLFAELPGEGKTHRKRMAHYLVEMDMDTLVRHRATELSDERVVDMLATTEADEAKLETIQKIRQFGQEAVHNVVEHWWSPAKVAVRMLRLLLLSCVEAGYRLVSGVGMTPTYHVDEVNQHLDAGRFDAVTGKVRPKKP
ncbi:MAG: hypothetical protein SFZ03_01905 [Candidatus Melainabacteria bacterium]|nr:hypothetical protein [Candidatus Melainabacteria bacterium]